MIQNQIQPIQLFSLMVLFEVGSAIVVGLGLEANQDAWLAILIGLIGGLGLFSLYVYLYLQFPDFPLTIYLEKIAGKLIGRVTAFVYIFFFLYIAARILRTFCDLLVTTVLEGTPIYVVTIMMMLPVCFGCYLGFEVIARTAETLFPWVMLFSFLLLLLAFINGLPKIEYIQPMLESGWSPIFHSVYPTILSFPYGETLVFAMFLPYLNQQKKGIIGGFLALIVSCLILTTATIIMITVLGAHLAKNSTFPLLDVIEKIRFGSFLQRLDPIAVILLIIGGFFKVIVFFCGAVEGFSSVIHRPEWTKYTIPVMAAAVVFMSIFMAENYIEHNKAVKPIANLLQVPLFMVIPFLLVVIVIIKRKITKN
jgi:spore germination protein KB